jgi:hypothetical protein
MTDGTPSSHEGITAALPSRQMFSSLVGADAQFSGDTDGGTERVRER